MRKAIWLTIAILLAVSTSGKKLSLKEMTRGDFRGESMAAVRSLSDGETYAALSDDGKRIVQYSFKTGQSVGTLFDVSTVKGANLEKIDGYQMSPDGRRMLIQTNTKRIYRHSLLPPILYIASETTVLNLCLMVVLSRLHYSLLMANR